MSEWISVKNEMPSDEVLCVDILGDYAIGNIYRDSITSWMCRDSMGFELSCITHWMSLPKPPEIK